MKQSLLTLAVVFMSLGKAIAAPFVMGDITFKDEFVIANKNISCSGWAMPLDAAAKLDTSKLVYVTYMSAMQQGSMVNIDGTLDGLGVSISMNIEKGSYTIALNQRDPALRSSSTGNLTGDHDMVSLDTIVNGKAYTVGCSKIKN